jgi:hypothetical protein
MNAATSINGFILGIDLGKCKRVACGSRPVWISVVLTFGAASLLTRIVQTHLREKRDHQPPIIPEGDQYGQVLIL